MTSGKANVSCGLGVSYLGKYFGIQNHHSMLLPTFDKNFIVKKFLFLKGIYFGCMRLFDSFI